jgi:hypothetical protein
MTITRICDECTTYCATHHVHILCANCDSEIEVLASDGELIWTHSSGIKGAQTYPSCAIHNHGLPGLNSIYGLFFAEHPTGLSATEWVERTH